MTGDPTSHPDDTGRPVDVGPRVEATRPLTRTQSLIWASQRLHPGVPLGNMGDRVRISGPVDPDRLVAAFDRVVRASDVLRTVVSSGPAGGPVARVLREPPRPTEVLDLPLADLDDWSVARIATPIDASTCVYDSVLLRHADDDWTWWLDVHHVAVDAWAAALLFEATAACYQHADDPDFDLTTVLDGAYYDRAAELADTETPETDPWADERAVPAPAFAPYGPRGRSTPAVDRLPVPLSADDRTALDEALGGDYRALSRELALLALSASAVMTVAHRLEGRDRLVVGVPIHHRSRRGAGRVAGPLMELYPMVLTVEPGDTHRTLFTRTLRSVIAVLRRARPGASPDVPFEVVLNTITARYGRFAGLPAEREWMRSGSVEPGHVLRVQIYDRALADDRHDVEFEVDLNTSLSGDGSHRNLPRHLAAVVRAMVAEPDASILDADLVDADEAAELGLLNPDPAPRHLDRPVHELIRDVLESDPGRVVAEHAGAELTAGDLDRRADAVALDLAGRGLVAGDAVGIRMGRGLDVLVAIQGVLRAGGRFVLLDPSDPAARHDAIVADAELFTVLDDRDTRAGGDTDGGPGAGDGDVPELPAVGLDDPAYVLYTSGSTGTPKGVPISHRGLADYLDVAVESYVDPDHPPVVALHSSLVFDLTVTSLFLGLLSGGRTVVFDQEPVEALAAVAADDRVTFLKATPTQVEIYTRLADRARPLRCVVVGGEAFRRPVAERLVDTCEPGVRVFNEYGPTEAVVGCMIHEWDPGADTGADVPIGAAMPGSRLLVLDAGGRPAPSGAWGELYVHRPGMADGYLNRPDLTAERFVELDTDRFGEAVGPAPVAPGIRWYRTGDRVRVVRPGVAVYGGRSDDQLKVGGIRLEPAEVEVAIVAHPRVETALVRVWRPADARSGEIRRCTRCGLGVDVPGVDLDAEGVCSVCRRFDAVEPQTRRWFRDDDDLAERLADAHARRRGEIDCLHLLSGGKDSTYALYQLVERGWRVHALTLDNGFISEGAKENIRRSVADLGITHEFATTPAMDAIFRDSLERYSNVCQGCYKTIYTLAVARAHELGIPYVVTGLSRGQFFETRLVPHQFEAGRFDPDAIDRTVLEARKVYHHTRDAVTELLPEQRVFDDDAIFDEIEFLDFYRYVDVELEELYRFLEERAPWVRPADTGRSTNCLINVAGIHVHQLEQGYHNYAEPYSWDVRLGHKRRDEALEELDDRIDPDEVADLLDRIGYVPKSQGVLTAWYRSDDGADVDPDELRNHLRGLLPEHAVPAAFVRVDEVPLAASAKADPSLLPAPTRFHRSGGAHVAPATPTETRLTAIWADVLGIESVGATDDFFDLGGASLDALEVVARVDAEFSTDLPDAAVFRHRTVRELAVVVDSAVGAASGEAPTGETVPALDPDRPAPLTAGEEALLFEYRSDPFDTRYNGGRVYVVSGVDVDLDRLDGAIRDVAERHRPLHTSFGPDRRDLGRDRAVAFAVLPPMSAADFDAVVRRGQHLPFDLDGGPLVRVHAARTGDGETSILIEVPHASVDAGTFDLLWDEVVARYHGEALADLPVDHAAFGAWQRERSAQRSAGFWLDRSRRRPDPSPIALARPASVEPDGFLRRRLELPADALSAGRHTPFARALAAAAATVRVFSGRPHVQIGVPMSTKDHPIAGPLVGYYTNTVPLDLAVDDALDFDGLCDIASAEIADVLPHRAYPLAAIGHDARAEGLVAPDVSVMLAYDDVAPARFPGATVRQRLVSGGAAVTDLTFLVQRHADHVDLAVEYRGTVLDAVEADRILSIFGEVLARGSLRPDLTVTELTADERLDDIDGGPLEVPAPTVLDRFVDRVAVAPDAPAVVDAAGEWSALELAAAADRVADEVARRLAVGGVRSRPRVGVAVGRSRGLVAAMVGAQAAGAAYVPLDPTVPATRLERIVAGADLDLLVVDDPGRHLGLPGERLVALVPLLDAAAGEEATVDSAESADSVVGRLRTRVAGLDPAAPAYVIFTSGSTGVPRGVEVSHANLAASTAARDHWYDERPSRFLVTSSPGFDSSLVGLVWPLATGGAVVVPGDDDVHDVDRLVDLIVDLDVTHTLMVPSLARALLDRGGRRLGGLTTSIVAGEACPAAFVEQHHRILPHVALVNEYGPTEATVWATAARLATGDDPVPIGRPIPGTAVRLVDAADRPVAPGVAGEMLLAGPGLTNGYLDDDVATAARFVELDGRRWYRTGDLARCVDGELVFLGRTDDQLNVGGNRVEPGEIEAVLRRLPGVTDAAVVAAGDPPVLVAHVAASHLDEAAARAWLTAELPAASVPRRFVRRDELPRTVHGKLDRAALGSGEELPGAAPEVAPGAGELVGLVIAAFSRAFDGAEVGPDTDFFDLGGDSLTAVEIVTAVGDAIRESVPIAHLLGGRTPAGITALIDPDAPLTLSPMPSDDGCRAVTLRRGRPGGPLVVMVPAWDDVFGYQALAEAFDDDVEVVALAYVGGADVEPITTVDDLCDRFEPMIGSTVAAATARDRPTAVLGWSVGGVVAVELAARLVAAGRRVDDVVLVDTYFPGQQAHLWSNRWWKYKSLLRPGALGEAIREFRVMTRRRVRRQATRLGRRLLAWSGTPLPAPPSRPTIGSFPAEAFSHVPPPPGTTIFFVSASRTNPARTIDRWRELTDDIERIVVPGRHRGLDSVMAADRVAAIATPVAERLAAAANR